MFDLIYLGVAAGFFAVMLGFVTACQRLGRAEGRW
jgi:hypothetical protein